MNYPLEKIEAHITGSGTPQILLLHGWGGDVDALNEIAEPLSQHRQVISLSFPGFGSSPEPSESWGTWEYVDFLNDWLGQQITGAVDVIGHSFGGRISIGLTVRYPSLVGRLVLIDSSGLKPRRSLKTRLKILTAKCMSRTSRIIGGRLSEIIDRQRERLGSEDWRQASPVMRGTLVRALKEDLKAELPKITAPTLLVWGNEDNETPLFMAKVMDRLIPDAKLSVIEGAGHFCYLERTGDVVSAIWKHLELPSVW